MSQSDKRVIIHSVNGYDEKYDSLLQGLIDKKVLLFCAIGKDCELWHDVMDELYVADDIERDFDLLTTWHENESLQEVIEFAKDYDEFGREIKIITLCATLI